MVEGAAQGRRRRQREVDHRAASTPLHLAAASGSADVDQRCCSTPSADVNAKEAEWGQTPLIFAAAQNRVEAIKALLARGADAERSPARPSTSRSAARSIARPVERQQQGARGVRSAKEQAADRQPGAGRGPGGARAVRFRQDSAAGSERQPDEQRPRATSIRKRSTRRSPTKGGMTALLHAVAAGLHRSGARAARRRRRHQPGRRRRRHQPAADGGDQRPVRHGDAADRARRRPEPRRRRATASTPLWAAVNTQWQPRTRFPQPQEMELQKATYLDVMKALLDKGADPNAPHHVASLVHGLHRLRQPQLRPRRHVRLDGVLARGVLHRPRGDEAAGRATAPTRTSRRWRRQQPVRRGGGPGAPASRRARAARSCRPPTAGHGEVRARRRFRPAARARSRFTPPPASNTAKASPATPIVTRRMRWLRGDEVSGRGARRRRQRARQRRLHAAASRRRARRQRDDPVSRVARAPT